MRFTGGKFVKVGARFRWEVFVAGTGKDIKVT